MATQHLYCLQCHKKSPTHQKLFEILYNFSKAGPERCPSCGGKRELHVNLDFQLGVGDGDFTVVSAFLPDKLESWLGDEAEEVTFYPFLVILQGGAEQKQFCWMPYWHVTGKEARYGQHAVCLEADQFESLVEQVQDGALQPA
jgi:hypothetical protein